ncbi:MAG: toprim domain-containing protein [Alphaproteobacteria bacterium]|nr:toprim domain-containing protein [Alphaproteobacteria bacterium]
MLDGLGLAAPASGFASRQTVTSVTNETEPGPTDADRTRRALGIWADGQPIQPDDLAARYLRGRGIDLDFAALDHVIRFNASTPWGRKRVPALLVRMQTLPSMNTCGVQRIALDADCAKIGKRMLGKAGYAFLSFDTCPGAALVTEGPEDALAALVRYRLPVWCAMSAGGLARFPVLNHWHTVAVLADGDDAGRSAALDLAHRWRSAGRTVHILDAPDGRDPNAMIEGAHHD